MVLQRGILRRDAVKKEQRALQQQRASWTANVLPADGQKNRWLLLLLGKMTPHDEARYYCCCYVNENAAAAAAIRARAAAAAAICMTSTFSKHFKARTLFYCRT